MAAKETMKVEKKEPESSRGRSETAPRSKESEDSNIRSKNKELSAE